MEYRLNNIAESFMNKIKKVRDQKVNDPLALDRERLKQDFNVISFSCPYLGEFLAKKFNDGHPFTYSNATINQSIEINNRLFYDFEKIYGIHENYSFNELKYFGNVSCVLPENSEEFVPIFLKSLTIPNSWTEIPDNAFVNYRSLETINFSDKIIAFGEQCFKNCTGWKDAHLSQASAKLGIGMFINVKVPKSFEIPHTVKKIPKKCFYLCTFLGDTLKIPDSVVEIGKSAFETASIKNIVVPDSVQFIGESAFSRNEDLITVRLSASLNEIPDECFSQCSLLKTVLLPNGIKRLSEKSFFSCESLETIEFPPSLQEIGRDAFLNTAINKITVHSKIEIDESNFSTNENDDNPLEDYILYIPNELKDYYKGSLIAENAHIVYCF